MENHLRKRWHICLLLFLFIGYIGAYAQNQKLSISGVVTDNTGGPVIGASIKIKGTSKGAVTDLNGKYAIDASPDDILQCSYIGFETLDIPVRNGEYKNIVLQEDNRQLNEVVVVGYGSMQKREVTSSITSVKGDELIPGIGGSTIATALQGKVSGLTISGTSSPNSSNGFQLRGVA
ncbi:MAG: carboxypeptidase-like regulatory domain-containing protein, partial [Bacteroidaceae bacterium]|nr:carboxypeptidase-like regulatory domain-containing protein [Bacteroidaceae bacterium]